MNDTLQKAIIQIDKLQHQVDSLKNSQALDQIKYRAIEHQTTVNQVKDFYSTSWTSLLWLIGILVGIVGLLLEQILTAIANRFNYE